MAGHYQPTYNDCGWMCPLPWHEDHAMQITYFRRRKRGPESRLEDAVADRIPALFPETCWAGGSVPVGAGVPDLVIVRCEPKVFALANVPLPNAQILAYLRAVGSARASTIANRIGQPEPVIIRCLDGLIEVQAVAAEASAYRLSPEWREILPEIATVEVKVANWRKAVEQASRNSIFAHKSFVAFPQNTAERVRREEVFQKTGIGLLGISNDNEVQVIRRPVRRSPRVWSYYYQLAYFAAKDIKETRHAFCSADSNSPGKLP